MLPMTRGYNRSSSEKADSISFHDLMINAFDNLYVQGAFYIDVAYYVVEEYFNDAFF